jgi:hypothetical protein
MNIETDWEMLSCVQNVVQMKFQQEKELSQNLFFF